MIVDVDVVCVLYDLPGGGRKVEVTAVVVAPPVLNAPALLAPGKSILTSHYISIVYFLLDELVGLSPRVLRVDGTEVATVGTQGRMCPGVPTPKGLDLYDRSGE